MAGNSAALTFLRVFADTGTECHSANQGQHATYAVHDGRAGKVVEYVAEGRHHETVLSVAHQPAAAPSPMTFHRVDNQRDNGAVNQVHRELCALSHGTADDGGSRSTEHCLENQETLNRQIALVERQVPPVGHTHETAQYVAAEHQSEANKEEQQ